MVDKLIQLERRRF